MGAMQRNRRSSPQTAAVLLALLDQGESWSYGYELCGRLGLKAGTIYPILMRLADRGQVETAWEQDAPRGRPPRHLYRLSPTGAALAADLRTEPGRTSDAPGMRRPDMGAAPT